MIELHDAVTLLNIFAVAFFVYYCCSIAMNSFHVEKNYELKTTMNSFHVEKITSSKLCPSAAVFLFPECAKTRLQASEISKIFPGVIPPDPRSKGEGKEGKGREGGRRKRKGKRKGK